MKEKTKERKSIPVIFPNKFNEDIFKELCVSCQGSISSFDSEIVLLTLYIPSVSLLFLAYSKSPIHPHTVLKQFSFN